MKPLLSVVIVNYNYGRFLDDAIKSVVSQNGFENCELIVVDGGSTDNSVEIIKKHADKISWWVSEPDKGQSDAFNKGFLHARGKWGCWVNADDLLLPGALQSVLEFVRTTPNADWVGGGVIWLDKELRVRKCSMNTQLPFALQGFCPGYIVGGPSSFFRISLLHELGDFDVQLHYAMDNDLWLRMLAAGCRLHVLNKYLWTFRIHESSKTSMNLGPHDVSMLPKARLHDRNTLYARYPSNMRYERFFSRFISLVKLLKGAYLRSFIDTLRYRNRNVKEVF